MKIVLIIFVMLVAGCATAPSMAPPAEAVAVTQTPNGRSEVFRTQQQNGSPVALRIFVDAKCEHPGVLFHLLQRGAAEIIPALKAAILTWEGRDWGSCWIEDDGVVYSLDEEGQPFQPTPRSKFKDVGA